MLLYLCRHGIAEDPSDKVKDADRALTEEGVKRFRRAAKGFASLEPEVRYVVTSPLLRARQTAAILRDALAKVGAAPRLVASSTLAPPANLKAFLDELRDLTAKDPQPGVVAVGHEPSMSTWVGQVCFGRAGNCEMKKGAVAAMDLAGDLATGRLLWVMQPGQLRGLG